MRSLIPILVLAATALVESPFAALQTAESHEAPGAIVDDGRTMYFTRSSADFETSTIRKAELREGRWRDAGEAPFAGSTFDAGASPSADGRFIYFTSHRPSGLKDRWNLGVAEADGRGGFEPPGALPAPINSDSPDCCLAAQAPGAVYFSSERDGTWEIFRASRDERGVFGAPAKLPATVNQAKLGQWPSYVDPGERFLIFSAIRPDGLGGDDLWIAFRTGGEWTAPLNLGPLVNTSGFEDNGILSPNGRRLLWSSRSTGTSEIREIAVEKLGISRLPGGP